MTIDAFTGQNRFLSNFFMVQVEYDGLVYPSVEHAYQAAKSLNRQDRERIAAAETAAVAKRMGQQLNLRADWEYVKIEVMTQLVTAKFSQEPLRSKLLATGNSKLVEGNHWNDVFWGVCRGKGQNHLGKILMKVRDKL